MSEVRPRPAIRLGALLAVALLARVPAVLFAEGYTFLDQQYQYIDPAWHLATGDAFLRTHEWTMGLRSWVYPGLLAGLFRLELALGIERAEVQLLGARALQALVSLLPVAAAWFVLCRWRPHRAARPALIAFAVFFLATHVGSQPNGPAFAALFSTTAVLLSLGPSPLHHFLAGLCLGVAFCARPQDAVLGPVLFVAALRGRARRAGAFVIGLLPGVLLQGFSDLAAWGGFLHSPIAYVRFNLFDGRNAAWGREPLYYYPLLVVLALLCLPPFVRLTWRQLARGAAHLPVAAWAAGVYLLAHSVPAHKAARFVHPALLLLYLVAFVGLFTPEPGKLRLQRAQKQLWFVLHAVAWLLVSFWADGRGPTRAAAFLGRRADFARRLVVVGGSATDSGGFFHLRRKRLEVVPLARADWPARLPALATEGAPLYVLACKEPLDLRSAPAGWRADLLLHTTDPFDLKRRHRRWVYRFIRRD